MSSFLLKTVAVDGVVYMPVKGRGGCPGCVGYENDDLCDAITAADQSCLEPDGHELIYVRSPSRWLADTEPRCVGARSFAFGAEVCPQRHECERFLDLARPVPTNPTYLEMWLCTPERSVFLPVSTPDEGEATV